MRTTFDVRACTFGFVSDRGMLSTIGLELCAMKGEKPLLLFNNSSTIYLEIGSYIRSKGASTELLTILLSSSRRFTSIAQNLYDNFITPIEAIKLIETIKKENLNYAHF